MKKKTKVLPTTIAIAVQIEIDDLITAVVDSLCGGDLTKDHIETLVSAFEDFTDYRIIKCESLTEVMKIDEFLEGLKA